MRQTITAQKTALIGISVLIIVALLVYYFDTDPNSNILVLGGVVVLIYLALRKPIRRRHK